MEKIEKYLTLSYKLEIIHDEDEGGYVASYPELPGCITCAPTIQEAIAMIDDAKKEWLHAAIDSGMEIPFPSKKEKYSGQFKIRMPKSLHRQLAEHSREEGISMNQYCLYLLSMNDAYKHHN